MTSFFSAEGGPIWIKISQTDAEWHVDCGDMVKIETRCKISIWRTFERIQWHVIPEPPATLHGAANCRIQCHDPRATCQHCRVMPPGEFNGMSSQSHVSHCRVLPLGEFIVMIPEPHATLQGVIIPSAILKIVFRHILFFKMQFGLWRAAASHRLRYSCSLWYTDIVNPLAPR